jgi:hypothetical protein
LEKEANLKFRIVFWDVDRRFRGMCSLHHHSSLMIEAAQISETSVDNYFTWKYFQKTILNFILAAVRTHRR